MNSLNLLLLKFLEKLLHHEYYLYFVKSLKEADDLILLPIYAASEDNNYGVTSESLAEKIGNGARVCSEAEIEEMIRNNKDTNDTYIFMGAGSISKLAHEIINRLK
mgnify:CR=1 FL=1